MVTQSQKGLLLFGNDQAGKKKLVDAARESFFQGGSDRYAEHHMYPDTLDLRDVEDVLTMVSFQGKRFIVFRNASGLKAAAKEYLSAYITNRLSLFDVFLVFEYEDARSESIRDPFLTLLKSVFPSQRCAERPSGNEATFARLFNSLRTKNRSEALSVIQAMLREKEDEMAPQIMGVLVNFVHNGTFSGKDKMLYQLWKTDRNIKTGVCRPRTALSLCLLKLFKECLR